MESDLTMSPSLLHKILGLGQAPITSQYIILGFPATNEYDELRISTDKGGTEITCKTFVIFQLNAND